MIGSTYRQLQPLSITVSTTKGPAINKSPTLLYYCQLLTGGIFLELMELRGAQFFPLEHPAGRHGAGTGRWAVFLDKLQCSRGNTVSCARFTHVQTVAIKTPISNMEKRSCRSGNFYSAWSVQPRGMWSMLNSNHSVYVRWEATGISSSTPILV